MIEIQELSSQDNIPYNLLLLADPSIDVIDRYLPNSTIYLGFLRDRIIGVYVLCPINKQTIEIKTIAIDELEQGKGYGSQLLLDAEQKARELGYKSILIGTGNTSTHQLRLYERLGYKRFDVKTDFFVINYPEPIYENGQQCKHLILLKKEVSL